MMQPLSCPYCGAPPPAGYVPPPDGRFAYVCGYCGQQSVHGEDAPPAQAPPIIIVQAPGAGVENVYQRAAATNRSVRIISWVVSLALLAVIGVRGVGTMMRSSSSGSMLSLLAWNGSTPLQCTGNDDISVSGVTATFNAGSAIFATGNCHVKCTDCTITAPTAIEASGNAQVTIVNGAVRGTSVLADATGNARVTITGNVTVAGVTQQSGNARVSAPAPQPKVARSASPVAAPKPTVKTPTPTKPKK